MPTETSTPTPPKPIAALIAMVEDQIERQNKMMIDLEKAVARLDQSMLQQLDLDFLEWLYNHVPEGVQSKRLFGAVMTARVLAMKNNK